MFFEHIDKPAGQSSLEILLRNNYGVLISSPKNPRDQNHCAPCYIAVRIIVHRDIDFDRSRLATGHVDLHKKKEIDVDYPLVRRMYVDHPLMGLLQSRREMSVLIVSPSLFLFLFLLLLSLQWLSEEPLQWFSFVTLRYRL